MARYCPNCQQLTEQAYLPGPGGRPDASCPTCMSLERERFLALLLDSVAPVMHGLDLLVDVAPSERTSPLLARLQPRRTLRVDFDPAADGRLVDVRASLTDLPLPDGSVDLLFCYHVLEHIPDDTAAMREIARVLSRRGVGILQVPWRPNVPTDEDPSASTEERVRRFGQADHVRYYGNDFDGRLLAQGLQVQRIQVRDIVGPQMCIWMGLTLIEAVWLVRPAPHPGEAIGSPWLGSGALRAALTSLYGHVAEADTLRRQLEVAETAQQDARRRLMRAQVDAIRWRTTYETARDNWALRRYRRVRRPIARRVRRR